ncbi:MAG: type II toxin-antitoxin system VapC family toxin [Deltaproteobacteria bacterium]|nr:type II toxin-antitoxin system VapC family toxin [Deltaproteobacteria bacterium]
MVVLDTHAVVWWAGDPGRLSAKAAAAINKADRVGLPTIVFWETALLVRKGRLDLGMSTEEWVEKIQLIPRVAALPLTPEVAVLADALRMHADPADRFVVATALHHRIPLITKDRLLRRLRIVKTIW